MTAGAGLDFRTDKLGFGISDLPRLVFRLRGVTAPMSCEYYPVLGSENRMPKFKVQATFEYKISETRAKSSEAVWGGISSAVPKPGALPS
jgi:hypothetical protein